MEIVVSLVVVAVLVYVVVDAVRSFVHATGTLWQKLLAVGRHSATILWARFTVAVAALADGAVWAADFLGSPQVAGAMQAHLDPRTVAAVMVAVAVVSELARRRTLRRVG